MQAAPGSTPGAGTMPTALTIQDLHALRLVLQHLNTSKPDIRDEALRLDDLLARVIAAAQQRPGQ